MSFSTILAASLFLFFFFHSSQVITHFLRAFGTFYTDHRLITVNLFELRYIDWPFSLNKVLHVIL